MNKNNIGIIGTGVMGSALSKNFLSKNFSVSVYDKDIEKLNKLDNETNDTLTIYSDINLFVASLEVPRKIMLMVPAGSIVDDCIEDLIKVLDKEDIIMDGGNSFFKDTIRRSKKLSSLDINFFGVGISGGEEGALKGPSIMPGGPSNKYHLVKDYLETIAAQKNGVPCCSYIGKEGAGHFVKMVHNGIEYAHMQIISEVYLILKNILNKTNDEIADIFSSWNETKLSSYLVEITSKVLREKDVDNKDNLVDYIVDASSSKGTGKWTSIESFDLGINISSITSSMQARIMSNETLLRNEVNTYLSNNVNNSPLTVENIKNAYYLSKVIAYTQGFSMMYKAGINYNWDLSLENIATTFTGGCIIQAKLLEVIKKIYKESNDLENLLLSCSVKQILIDNIEDLKLVNIEAIKFGVPTPSISSTLTYINQLTSKNLGANLVQGQRDYFGAHTFKRIDKEGTFHHDWN